MSKKGAERWLAYLIVGLAIMLIVFVIIMGNRETLLELSTKILDMLRFS